MFDHARALHLQAPDSPLPRHGEPYPDDERHHRRTPKQPHDYSLVGADAARVLREHFANPPGSPDDLVDAFHDIHVPVHPNDRISAAARTADPIRVRATGRWLVRHSTDRCSTVIGLALIEVAGTVEDIALIQTIGLLSDMFCPLAALALERLEGGTTALLWLADRVADWGRVYVIEALCRRADPAARPWLLRHAVVDDSFLNGYFAGKVAQASGLHEAIVDPSADDDLVDHAGRLLHALTDSEGRGTTIEGYPHAALVLDAHARHLGMQEPTASRFTTAAKLANYLYGDKAANLGLSQEELNRLREAFASVLNREDWRAIIHRAWSSDAR